MGSHQEIGVEVKATVTGDDVGRALSAWGLQAVDARRQEIWFLDAPHPDGPRLLTSGIVLRLRRKKDTRWTSTVKLRPAVLERLVGDFAPGSDHFGDGYAVEFDWARSPVLAACMDGKVEADEVDAVLRRPGDVGELLSGRQHRLLDEVGAPPPEAFVGLQAAGPVTAWRWEGVTTGRLDDVRVEQWCYGDDGATFLEFSLRASDLGQARARRDDLLDDLGGAGLKPDPGAAPKTETVLTDLLR